MVAQEDKLKSQQQKLTLIKSWLTLCHTSCHSMEIVKSWKHFQKFIKYKLLYLILWFFKYEQRAKFLYYSCILVFTYHAHFTPKKDWVSYYLMLSGRPFRELPELERTYKVICLQRELLFPRLSPRNREACAVLRGEPESPWDEQKHRAGTREQGGICRSGTSFFTFPRADWPFHSCGQGLPGAVSECWRCSS